MRHIRSAAVTALVMLCALQPRPAAQRTAQIFIHLLGPDDKPITDLGPDEVSVTENGIPCEVLRVEAVTRPVKLQVLVDNGPANTQPLSSLREGLRGLFDELPVEIETSIYTTAGTPRPLVRPTTERQQLLDGIPLITPDDGAGMFVDALLEALERIEREKAPGFPVILMIGSDVGALYPRARDFQRLQELIVQHAVTVHVSLRNTLSSSGGVQAEVGRVVTEMTGGRFEVLALTSRLATLLPEFGARIAASHARQLQQMRVTYDRPARPDRQPRIGVAVRREGTPTLSLDGRLP